MKPSLEQHSLAAIRKARGARFWRWVMPYLRLLGGSVPGILFSGLVLMLIYSRIVDGLPDTFPAIAVTTVILTVAARTVVVRTYLVQADLIYLLPMQSRMGEYFRACMPASTLVQLLKISAFWAVLWQLYQVHPLAAGRSFLVIGSLLLLLKLLSLYGWWMENRIIHAYTRIGFSALRTLYLLALIYAALAWGTAYACLAIGAVSILYIGLLQLPRKSAIAWERLIALERKRNEQWIRLLQQFVEVGGSSSTARPSVFARTARWIPYRRNLAYHYVSLIVWSRSPISRISLSLLLTSAIIIWIIDELWLKGIVWIIAVLALRMQLRELERYQAHNDWSYAIPMAGDRQAAAQAVARWVWMCALFALLLVSAVSYWVY